MFFCSIPPNTWPDRHCKGIEIVVPHGHDVSSCCCLLNQKRLWMIASKRFLSNSHDFLARWVELSTHQRINGSTIRKSWSSSSEMFFPLFLKSLQVINFSQEVMNQGSSDENNKKVCFFESPSFLSEIFLLFWCSCPLLCHFDAFRCFFPYFLALLSRDVFEAHGMMHACLAACLAPRGITKRCAPGKP